MSPTFARRMSRARRTGLAILAAVTLATGPSAVSPAARAAAPSPPGSPLPQPETAPSRTDMTPPVRRACAIPAPPRQASCLALVRTDVPARQGIQQQTAPAGLGAIDLRRAYRLPSATAGKGQTVAIIDVYDNPRAESDLAIYRAQYGLPPCTTANGCFRKVNEKGGRSLPPPDTGWAQEESLDLDMVSAACPNCHILLVEAGHAAIASLGTGVNTAVRLGARYISNSYGGAEDSLFPQSDASYFDHPGVAITAASGDSGYGVLYPATSRYVTAVGGTSLTRAANARGWDETAWSGAGSGCAGHGTKPRWQRDSGCARRTVADVSAVADPRTGVAVYDTFGMGGWLVIGGTSASAPLIAGAYALAGPIAPGAYAAAIPYAHAGALNDITSGSNGTCSPAYLCTAGPGYDGPTGLGTPDGVAAFRNRGAAAAAAGPAMPGDRPRATAEPGDRGGGSRPGTGPAGAAPSGRAPAVVAPSGRAPAVVAPSGTGTAGIGSRDHAGDGQVPINGDFETGRLNGWRAHGRVVTVTADHPHGGRYAALLGDPDTPMKGTSSIVQGFIVPRGRRTLSFWYNVSCPDRETYDWATATLRDDTTGVTSTVLPRTCTYDDTWQRVTAPVVAGHTYTLTLASHDDGYFGDPTATKYDDVTIT